MKRQLALLVAVLIGSAAILLTVSGRPGVLEDQLEKIKENDDVPLEIFSINSPRSEGVFDGSGDGFSYKEKYFELHNKTNNSKSLHTEPLA